MSQPMLALRGDAVSWAPTDDGAIVVLDLRTSKYLSLNSSGSVLWQELARGVSADELVQALIERFGVTTEVAEADVAEFLATLRERDLLVER